MTTIVFASSKGGAGKTTSCVVLACELARQGFEQGLSVSLIDADPNQHSAAWAKMDDRPENINLFENVTSDNILDVIEQAQNTSDFVLVDLEGVASSAVVGAVSCADLVIIPCQASQNDAREAAKTINTIKYGARIAKRNIDFSVLFTRVPAAIITKTSKHLSQEFTSSGVNVLDVSLIDREAFKSIFTFGGSVNTLQAETKSEQASYDKAAANAKGLAENVKQRLSHIFSEEEKAVVNG